MMDRRIFLQGAGAALAALCTARGLAARLKSHPLGIQFFTFSSLASTGWDGFSQAMGLAHILGYESLEFAGLLGHAPEKILARGRELGLAFHSLHMGNDQVRAARKSGQSIQDVQAEVYTPSGVVEVAKINLPLARDLGCRWGVIGAAGRNNFVSKDSLLKLCDAFNSANELARGMNMGLSYHTHPTDFIAVEGLTPFDFIVAHTDPSIRYQIDVCWAAAAGADPAALIDKHHKRLVSLHLRDLAANKKDSATPGDGVLDFDAIRKAAARIESPLFYVEREGGPNVNAAREAKRAIDFLTQHGW